MTKIIGLDAVPWPGNLGPDIGIILIAPNGHTRTVTDEDFGSKAAYGFLLSCLAATNAGHDGSHRAIKLIKPREQGHIVRSDIVPLRLVDCALVDCVVSFCAPQHYFSGEALGSADFEQLPEIFAASAAGALVTKDPSSTGEIDAQLLSLDAELRNRLSFPWLVPQRRPRMTIAVIEGRYSHEHGENIYLAAKALGIDMIVFDRPGHWLEGPSYASWRKSFVPIDMTVDTGLPQRIKAAIQHCGHEIHGMVTFNDPLMAVVARIAQELFLPTGPPDAYATATDKYRTGIAEGRVALRGSSITEAVSLVESAKLEYPLIIKPCLGWLSEGVYRVRNVSELEAAISKINTERHGKDFVIERYCDGPEVDANFILCDGEILFFEASDDFPKYADTKNPEDSLRSFIELDNVLPSELPPRELEILRNSLHQSLLRLGLDSGVFHLEGRVQDSVMEYRTENGITELARRKKPPQSDPSAWLIEINTRPPGIQASDAVQSTYGIDYWGVRLLFALNDIERAKALSQPFQNGPQYWCEMVFIPIERGGVFDSDDVCVDLIKKCPDLAAHISKSWCFWKRGDSVPDPSSGLNLWIAYYVVFSRTSRAHLLTVAHSIREETRWSFK